MIHIILSEPNFFIGSLPLIFQFFFIQRERQ